MFVYIRPMGTLTVFETQEEVLNSVTIMNENPRFEKITDSIYRLSYRYRYSQTVTRKYFHKIKTAHPTEPKVLSVPYNTHTGNPNRE